MRKKSLIILILIFVGLLSLHAKEQAIIILDASGSMWGKIEGKEKIVIAKDALKKVIEQWDPKTNLGLMVYGHRKKGDCNDIELIVPLSDFNKKNFLAKVENIVPKGKTPISRALKKAAKTLRHTEDKATVILISDGKETCDDNPCAVAKELKKSGIDFVTHVIGFNVDKVTDEQLTCIAKATGGEYFSAKNAPDLNKALKTVVKKVEEKPKEVTGKVELSASETKGGKNINAKHSIYRIIDKEKNELKYVAAGDSYKDKPVLKKIPAGDYEVRTSYNKFRIKTHFSVKANETTKLNIVLNQTGKVELSTSETKGGQKINAKHSIYRIIDKEKNELKYVAGGNSYKDKPLLKKIPVGDYEVRTSYNKFKTKTHFSVKANETTKLNIVLGQTGKVELSASETKGGQNINATHSIYRIIDKEKNKLKYVAGGSSYKDKPVLRKIPVGDYEVRTSYNGFKIKTHFSVKANETTKLNIVVGSKKK